MLMQSTRDGMAHNFVRKAVDHLAARDGDGSKRAELIWASDLVVAGESHIRTLVRDAREEGMTWAEIGEALGVSPQAAHRKYRNGPPEV